MAWLCDFQPASHYPAALLAVSGVALWNSPRSCFPSFLEFWASQHWQRELSVQPLRIMGYVVQRQVLCNGDYLLQTTVPTIPCHNGEEKQNIYGALSYEKGQYEETSVCVCVDLLLRILTQRAEPGVWGLELDQICSANLLLTLKSIWAFTLSIREPQSTVEMYVLHRFERLLQYMWNFHLMLWLTIADCFSIFIRACHMAQLLSVHGAITQFVCT